MRVAGVWAGVAIVVAGGLRAPVSAQLPPEARLPRPGTTATSSATQVISPVALVTWVARYGSDGARVLDLLVLWRGSPGWFMRGSQPRGSSGGGSGGSFHSTITYGGLDLQLGFQAETRVAEIQGQSVRLKDANVILVDHVDTSGKLEVVGTMRIDPEFPPTEGPPRIDAVLRRSPEIVSFLRCDARLPDGRAQAMIDVLCAQMLAK